MNFLCDVSSFYFLFVMNFEHFVRHFLTSDNYKLNKITFTIYQSTSVKIWTQQSVMIVESFFKFPLWRNHDPSTKQTLKKKCFFLNKKWKCEFMATAVLQTLPADIRQSYSSLKRWSLFSRIKEIKASRVSLLK